LRCPLTSENWRVGPDTGGIVVALSASDVDESEATDPHAVAKHTASPKDMFDHFLIL
jgi:hypothetical protein